MKINITYPRVYAKFVFVSFLLSIIVMGLDQFSPEMSAFAQTTEKECVQYDSKQKLIYVQCKSIHLSDINDKIGNATVLHMENSSDSEQTAAKDKVWILDAGIVIEPEGELIIDSSDTSWLKMVPTPTYQQGKQLEPVLGENETDTSDVEQIDNEEEGVVSSIQSDGNGNNADNIKQQPILVSNNNDNNPNGIHVRGALKIDSVKITSWDPEANDVIGFALGKRPGEEHTKTDYDTAQPRAFIRVSKGATGTADITNSELGYLGYSCSRCAGLSYYGGEGSILKGNDIHHLLKGYYSKNMGEMLIQDNKVHDNYLYGIDPHTGTHDLSIIGNTVYNNNASGIICSKHCYNLLIEGNRVYNNSGAGRGIAFSINTTNSVAKDNYVSHNPRCFSFNRDSNFNEVYNNTLSDCREGFSLSDTKNNSIHDNVLKNINRAFVIQNFDNKIVGNNVSDTVNGIVFEKFIDPNMTGTKEEDVTIDRNNNAGIFDNITENNVFTDIDKLTLVRTLKIKDSTK